MEEYYQKRIDKYIEEVSSLRADVDCLRMGIVHSVCYLSNPSYVDVKTALDRLETCFNIAKYNDGCYKQKLMDNFIKSEQ